MNKKSILYQAMVLAISSIALNALAFGYRILLARLIGSEGMGVYALMMRAYSVMHALVISGSAIGVSVLVGELSATGTALDIRRVVRQGILLTLIPLTLVTVVILVFATPIAATLLGDARIRSALGALVFCIALTAVENVMKSAFNATKKVVFPATSEIAEQILRLIFVVWLLIQFGTEPARAVVLIVVGMTLAEIFSVGYLAFWYRRAFPHTLLSHRARVPRPWKRLISIAAPAEGSVLAGALLASLTTVILPMRLIHAGYNHTQAISALGLITGMAEPLMMLPYAIVCPLATVLLPAISRSRAAANQKSLQHRSDYGLRITGLIAIPSTLALLPLAPALLSTLFQKQVDPIILTLLALSVVIECYIVVVGGMLNGASQQGAVFRCGLMGQLLQPILVFILAALPGLRITGYVIGVLIGDALRILLLLRRVQHTPSLRIRLWRIFGLPLALGAFCYLFSATAYSPLLALGSTPLCAALVTLLLCGGLCIAVLHLSGVHVIRYFYTHLRAPR